MSILRCGFAKRRPRPSEWDATTQLWVAIRITRAHSPIKRLDAIGIDMQAGQTAGGLSMFAESYAETIQVISSKEEGVACGETASCRGTMTE
jgi:hypothetical protein